MFSSYNNYLASGVENLLQNNDEAWYSFQKQKTFDHGLAICLYHENNGVSIERRDLNIVEDLDLYADEYNNIWIQNSYHLKVQEVFFVPVIFPVNLYLCCADNYCIHELNIPVSGISDEITCANVIGCALCKLLVCSKNCLTKNNLCLQCADIHLCSKKNFCKDYNKTDQWPGWLLRKKTLVSNQKTNVLSSYCTFIDCYYICHKCDAKICVHCIIPNQDKQLCIHCAQKVKPIRRSK